MRRFALLRGINVGGRTVKSAELRRILEDAGFDDVATFLASGNAILDAEEEGAALEARIEAALREGLGYPVATFTRSCGDLAEVASPARLSGSPLAEEAGVTINIVFMKGAVPADLAETTGGLRTDDDDFLVHGRELYWLRRGRMSESPAWQALEKAIAGRGTTRNLNTVRRLVEKFCP